MTRLNCGEKCLQIVLIVLNSLVLICGIGLIIIGVISEFTLKNYREAEDTIIRAVTIFIICSGCFVFVIGFLGFCGACMKNACMLIAYCVLLSILALAEIAGGVCGLIYRKEINVFVDKQLQILYANYDTNPSVQQVVEAMQTELRCCGLYGTWQQVTATRSCQDSKGQNYTDGCVKRLDTLYQENVAIIAGCVFGFALIQIICMIFAAFVAHVLRFGKAQIV